MRLSKFILSVVLGFIAGLATHGAMVRHGLSLHNPFGHAADPAQTLNAAIKSRQSTPQYVAIRGFFAAFPSHANLVMFGDSQIAFADWQELLDSPTANRGIYGDTTAGALLRVDSIIAGHPKCVATELGIGDFAIGRDIESTAHDYSLILDRLVASGAMVLVQSTLPTEPPYALSDKVKDLNNKIQAACHGRCSFVDLDNIITPGSTIDGVHLQPNTYKKWAAKLKPLIAAHCITSP